MKVRIELEIPAYVDGNSDLDEYVAQFIVAAAEDIAFESMDGLPKYTIVEDSDEDTN